MPSNDGCLVLHTCRSITARNFVPIGGVKITTVRHRCCTATRVCAVTIPLLNLHKLDRPSQPIWRVCQCRKLKDQTFPSCAQFGTDCIFSTGSWTKSVVYSCEQSVIQIRTKNTEVLCLSRNTRHPASKRHHTAAGREVPIPWGGIGGCRDGHNEIDTRIC